MGYQEEYEKTHRTITINDYGREVRISAIGQSDTWHELVEMAIDAISGLGYLGLPSGGEVSEWMDENVERINAREDA